MNRLTAQCTGLLPNEYRRALSRIAVPNNVVKAQSTEGHSLPTKEQDKLHDEEADNLNLEDNP